ncbi:hypothetical protein V8G54_006157, partial [Vigna mungo]
MINIMQVNYSDQKEVQQLSYSYPEVGQNIFPLNILSPQTNLLERMVLVTLKISQRNLKHSMFESIRSNLGALSASDESLANILDLKHRRSLDVVPILLGKRISGLLLATLFPFRYPLVLSHCHYVFAS